VSFEQIGAGRARRRRDGCATVPSKLHGERTTPPELWPLFRLAVSTSTYQTVRPTRRMTAVPSTLRFSASTLRRLRGSHCIRPTYLSGHRAAVDSSLGLYFRTVDSTRDGFRNVVAHDEGWAIGQDSFGIPIPEFGSQKVEAAWGTPPLSSDGWS
jgi:hypothetical protein